LSKVLALNVPFGFGVKKRLLPPNYNIRFKWFLKLNLAENLYVHQWQMDLLWNV